MNLIVENWYVQFEKNLLMEMRVEFEKKLLIEMRVELQKLMTMDWWYSTEPSEFVLLSLPDLVEFYAQLANYFALEVFVIRPGNYFAFVRNLESRSDYSWGNCYTLH
jgi:hypothetical protein